MGGLACHQPYILTCLHAQRQVRMEGWWQLPPGHACLEPWLQHNRAMELLKDSACLPEHEQARARHNMFSAQTDAGVRILCNNLTEKAVDFLKALLHFAPDSAKYAQS